MVEKEDDVAADDDDDDMMRTGVSQNRVTVILCTEELFLRTQCIKLTYQTGKNAGGRKRTVNMIHKVVPVSPSA